mmetsp:Transcript_71073/g.123267  ORF Transcript_71073/g.123267 Transcript_71073/m.123267 type:complete len:200 (+) Transcript_71073:44-643(+)
MPRCKMAWQILIIWRLASMVLVRGASRVGPSKYYKELDVDKFEKVFQKDKDSIVLFYTASNPLSIKLNPQFERLAADVKKRSKHVSFFRIDEGQQRFPTGKWPGLEKLPLPKMESAGLISMSQSAPSVYYVNASSAKGAMLNGAITRKLVESKDDEAYSDLLLYVYFHGNWRVSRKLKKHPELKRRLKQLAKEVDRKDL